MKLKVVLFGLVAAAMGLAANVQAQATPPERAESLSFQKVTAVLSASTTGGGSVSISGYGPYLPPGVLAPQYLEKVNFDVKSSDWSYSCYKLAIEAKTLGKPFFINGTGYPTGTGSYFLTNVTFCTDEVATPL